MELFVHGGMFARYRSWRPRFRTRDRMMELHLQFGYGMMQHCRHLLTEWKGGTVVLSPRDLNHRQLLKMAEDVAGIRNSRVMLDPQFYLPYADHDRLCSHDYWPDDFASGSFFDGPKLRTLMKELFELNQGLGAESIILPGMLATNIDDLWLAHHHAFLEVGRELADGEDLFSTLALDSDTIRNRDQMNELLETISEWEADGYYIVCEHPNGEYLVQDPIWLAHVLDLTAGLRLSGAKVVLGYCNHQMLAAHAAGANAICSGTWMNVRSFPPDKFRSSYEEEIRRRATWYYCPQSLSEYTIPFLDVAHEQGVLDLMKPSPELDGGYVDQLFRGLQPSSVRLSEQSAFRHYLHTLHAQVHSLSGDRGYEGARETQEQLLIDADDLLSRLAANGVLGGRRDFRDCIEVNRAALSMLNSLRGPTLRRKWVG